MIFVCWKWKTPGYRSQFTAEHVNILYRMIQRNYQNDFELCCITDDSEGINKDIRIIPLWDDLRDVARCTVRLKAFSEEAAEIIGPRFCSIDCFKSTSV